MSASRSAQYAVFVCPILSGSGVRVKLLEAFAAGIPAVSTTIGAEGLAETDGEFCLLRTRAEGFAERGDGIVCGSRMRPLPWPRAPALKWKPTGTWRAITRKLVESYGELVRQKRN